MKKILLSFIAAFMVVFSYGQKVDSKEVPAPATVAFAKEYPAVKNNSWSKQGENYATEYTSNNVKYMVTYDIHGYAVESQNGIEQKALPQTAVDYVRKSYPNKDISEVAKVTMADKSIYYKVWVADQVVSFDKNGSMITIEKH